MSNSVSTSFLCSVTTMLVCVLFLSPGCTKEGEPYHGEYIIQNQSGHSVDVLNLVFMQSVQDTIRVENGSQAATSISDKAGVPSPWSNPAGDVQLVFDDSLSLRMTYADTEMVNNILYRESWDVQQIGERSKRFTYTIGDGDYLRARNP